ncbi:MAG: zf-HC2 domain-containing protein [Thermoanaerobaculia bacterium]
MTEKNEQFGERRENRGECGRSFDEALLTGYLDHALTQEEEQRVRVHLEDCGTCRELVEELTMMRRTTMETEFKVPTEDQWDERPRGTGSGLAFSVGWLMLIIWAVGIAGFVLGEAWQGTQSLGEKLFAFGGLSAVALLVLSVVIDRLRTLKTDRYRRVKK